MTICLSVFPNDLEGELGMHGLRFFLLVSNGLLLILPSSQHRLLLDSLHIRQLFFCCGILYKQPPALFPLDLILDRGP